MAKFRKRPVVIDAYQYNGSATDRHMITRWMTGGAEPTRVGIRTSDYAPMTIETLEGDMTAQPGDWIIKGVHGEFYPVKPDIFAETYEAVEE